MILIEELFQAFDEQGLPYNFEIERSSNLTHAHAHGGQEGFSIDCPGDAYLLAAPPLSEFTLTVRLRYTYLEETDPCFFVFFQYDRQFRRGLALSFRTELSGRLTVGLWRLDGIRREALGKPQVFSELTVSETESYELCLSVRRREAQGRFGGREFSFPLPEGPAGAVGLTRGNFIGALILSSVTLETPEALHRRELSPRITAAIPLRNGGRQPYRLEYQFLSYGGAPFLEFTLADGVSAHRFPPNGQYDVQQDYFTAPYVRLRAGGASRTFYLANGRLAVSDPGLWWNCLKDYFQAADLPIARRVAIEPAFTDAEVRVSFGYSSLECKGYEMQKGASEFVFDQKGKLLYAGDPLESDRYEVQSPDKRILALLPRDCADYPAVRRHFEENHYFVAGEAPRFRLVVHTARSMSWLSAKAELLDVFGDPLGPLSCTRVAEESWEAAGPVLEPGVYRVRFRVAYGDAPLRELTRTFEVLEPGGGVSPAQASGLPFLYSMPNEQRGLERDAFDPWSPKDSCDQEHYISCVTFLPEVGERKRIWELTRLFNREWYAWLEGRTTEDWSAEAHLDTVRHADYLCYPTPYNFLPFRNDLWKVGAYRTGLRQVLDDFLQERPEYACQIGCVPGEPFTKANLDALHRVCHAEWYDYACGRIQGAVLAQNEQLRAWNPQWKRAGYGPMPVYVAAALSYWQARSTGHPPDGTLTGEFFTGFAQFEDYPFACGYPTSRGAFAAMSLLLHCPGLALYPEQYPSSHGGCIDGAVKFAHPPLAKTEVPPYFSVTHALEYVYNTPHRRADGFHYWTKRGFMQRDFTEEETDAFVRGWGRVRRHEPARPLRSTAYLMEYGSGDDRYDPDYSAGDRPEADGFGNLHNVSEEGQAYLYQCSRPAGIPAGFALDWEGLAALSAGETDLLVLPSLRNAPPGALEQIRTLYAAGVSLFAVSAVDGLEDLFGVAPASGRHPITVLERIRESEWVTPCEVEFHYRANGAEVLVWVDGGMPVLLRNGRAALLNAPVSELGRDSFLERDTFGRESVSLLLREACRAVLWDLSQPLAYSDAGTAGLTLFADEHGNTMLLVIDYSPYLREGQPARRREVEVRLELPGLVDAAGPERLVRLRENGVLKGLVVPLLPQESALIQLK